MNIKKADDKPMVIHTKEKAKLHVHTPKGAGIKGHNVYTIDRTPKIKGSMVKPGIDGNPGKGTFRKSTVHQNKRRSRNPLSMYQNKRKDSSRSVKVGNAGIKNQGVRNKETKGSGIRNAGITGVGIAADQLEGGGEVRESAMIASTMAHPVIGIASKGAVLFHKKVLEERKSRIKKVETGRRIGRKQVRDTASATARKLAKDAAKKAAKETAGEAVKETAKRTAKVTTKAVATAATGPLIGMAAGEVAGIKMDMADVKRSNRNRKLRFFMDKMKAQDHQNDSVVKLVKDLVFRRASIVIKYVIKYVGTALLALFLMVAIMLLPVILVVAVIYNSPFAIFMPPLESGDTVMSVTSRYVQEFNRDTATLANDHTGYDSGIVVYVDYEGVASSPSYYYDIIAVYMVKYGIGDTAAVMNDTSKGNLKTVFDAMCSYSTSSETVTTENDDGTSSSSTVLHVNILLKSYRDMITEYSFSSEEIELLEEIMSPENLALLGYSPGGGSGGTQQSSMSQAEINAILSAITDAKAKQACAFALSKVGYPYSQAYRDSGDYYDCSSLAYYAWKAAGVNISYGGINTAAQEAKYCSVNGYTVEFSQIQPGDLIFYSSSSNGQFMNITHVGIYVGNGMMVEAQGTATGVVYSTARTKNMVLVGRPQ